MDRADDAAAAPSAGPRDRDGGAPVDAPVVIVGAGLAGLACARGLAAAGRPCLVFEAADRVGGRVVTDRVDGFLVDRGFQVLLDAYPALQDLVDPDALGARAFDPGALVRTSAGTHRVVDPWRAPLAGLGSLRAPFVGLGDALRMLGFRRRALAAGPAGGAIEPGTAAELLERRGFSPALRRAFFEPFFGGVTLDPALGVPAGFLLDLFGWFARGSAVLPEGGMQALPEAIAAGLPEGTVRLGVEVAAVRESTVELATGERLEASAVVLATDGGGARRLLGLDDPTAWLGATTLCYDAPASPVGEPLLVLDGTGAGPVNHLAVLTDAQPAYAPPGRHLVSATVLGIPEEDDEALDRAVRAQLAGWYGDPVASWRTLRVDRVRRALPSGGAPAPALPAGVHLAGDHTTSPSIQGALVSGRAAAGAVLGAG